MSIDTDELRKILGYYPTGVCVVTASIGNNTPIGMTINSFASVSMDPPLVLWSIRNDSECFEEFYSTEKFGLNILSGDGADIAKSFARKGDHGVQEKDYSLGTFGSPILHKSTASLECSTWRRYEGGDHTIFVAKVLGLQDSSKDQGPLIFHRGSLSSLFS